MSKKLDFDYIKNFFIENKYKLLSTQYISNKNSLKYECPEGHIGAICFYNFKNGQRCKICSYNNKRKSFEEIKDIFTQRGCVLLSETYKNSNKRLLYRCQCGREKTTILTAFIKSKECRDCHKDRREQSINDVKLFFELNKCKLLTDNYINKTTKLDYLCKCGKKHAKHLKDFEKRPFCPNCSKLQMRRDYTKNNKNKYDIEEVKYIFNKAECKLLSNEYTDIESKLNYICSCGNNAFITLHAFNKGQRCRKCGTEKLIKSHTFTKEYVNSVLSQYNCELISDYKTASKPIVFRCKCGNNGKKTFTNFQRHPYCRKCTFSLQTQHSKRSDLEQVQKEKKLKVYMGGVFRQMLKGSKSTQAQLNKFGYGSKEFVEHVSKFRVYSTNRKDFSIDHIFPFKAFFEHNIWDLKVINHLSNIQLLTRSDNCKKNKQYNKHDFYNWLESIGYNDYEKQIQ